MPTTPPDQLHLLAAANRGVVRATLTRWLVHALRNPLQSLSMVPALVGQDGNARLDDLASGLLTDGVRRSAQLLELFDELARPESDQPVPVDTTAMLGSVDRLLRLQRHGGTVRVEIASLLPAVVATPGGLLHVVMILALNAIEAVGGRQDGHVRISTLVGDRVVIVVEDDGPGLAAEVRGRLFEPFATTRSWPLAGLGLAVARGMAEQWGATLAVSDAPGENGSRGRGVRAELSLAQWPENR